MILRNMIFVWKVARSTAMVLLVEDARMGNALFATGYGHLLDKAKKVIKQIIVDGSLDYPRKDGTTFGNGLVISLVPAST